MKYRQTITLERLHAVARLDADQGRFFATCQRGPLVVGDMMGRERKDGYRTVCIDGVDYLEHRLVWFWTHEEWPKGDVDHREGYPNENRPGDIRDSTRSQNLANSKRPKHNTSGFKGVAWHSKAKRWRAEISVNRKRIYLGLFDNPVEAHAAYCIAADQHHGEFARHE